MKFELIPSFFDLKSLATLEHETFQKLGIDSAQAELQMVGRSWSNVFTMSQSNAFFIKDKNETLVISFQLFSIKAAAYSPFFPLETMVKQVLSSENENFLSFLRSPEVTL